MKAKKTYVIFDGDQDHWGFGFLKGWRNNHRIDFDFDDAHSLFTLTERAKDEAYIKAKLRGRFVYTSEVIVIIGESTRFLYKYVRWELEVALSLGLPIIAVNLNNRRSLDWNLCPPIIRETGAVHISFKLAIIRYALQDFTATPRPLRSGSDYYYPERVYRSLGL